METIQKKLIFNHKYIIIEDNETYYGTCICPESYLFTDVMKSDSMNKYIGIRCFSKKDYFVDQHMKMD